MKTMTSTKFQRSIGQVIDDVRTTGEAVRVTIRGHKGVVIADCDEYDRLQAIQRTYKAERDAMFKKGAKG